MAQITWNQMQAPDFKAANALLLSGQEQFNTAIGQAGKVVTDYQAANTKNNTQAIMNALQSAKSPEEYQAALESAQAIAATKSGDYDQDKFNAARLTQPGVLDAQQQQQLEIADRPIMLQIQQGLLEGKKREDLAPLYGQLQSNAGRTSGVAAGQQAFANTETLKGSETAARTAANTEARIASDERSNAIKEAALRQKEYVAAEGGTTYRDPVTGETRTMNSVDSVTGGIPSSGSKGGSTKGTTAQQLGDPSSVIRQRAAPYEADVNKVSAQYNLPPSLLMSLVAHESSWDINTKGGSDTNANLVQMIKGTRDTNNVTGDMKIPAVALDAAAREITRLQKVNPKASLGQVIQAYHDGNFEGRIGKGGKADSTYSQRILNGMQAYEGQGQVPSPSDAATTIATGKAPKASSTQEYNSRIAPIVGTKAIQGYQGDLTTTLRNINTQSGIKEEKGDTATNEANEAKYLSKNKPGIIQAMFNLNSGSKRQRSIGESVDGFNLLPSKTRLAIMEKVAAENNTETFKYWSSLGEDELRAKFASSVKKAMDTEVPGLSLKRQVAVENAVTKFNQDNVWGRNGAPSPYAQLSAVIGSDEKADTFIRTYPDSDLSKSILGSSPNGAPTPAQAANAINTPAPGKPVVVPKPVVPVVPRTPEDTPLGVRAIQGIGGVLGNISDATSVSSIASSLFRGGSDATREAANKLKYGSLYPYMKANNDPRLKN